MKKVFKYLEPLWTGFDGKISLRATGAIAFIIDFISNLHHAIYKWDTQKSLEGLSLVLGIEAGLIAALLGITAWSNMISKKIDAVSATDVPTPVTVETLNVENVETVNTQNTV